MDDQQRQRWVLPPRTGAFRGVQLDHLDPGDPDERQVLIEAEHPEYADALEAGEEVVVDGEPTNPALHLTLHAIVATQVIELQPPESWDTAQRLTRLGYERHEVVHMLGGAVATQLWRATHDRQPFDLDAFVADLAALPETWEQQRMADDELAGTGSDGAAAAANGAPSLRMRFDVDDEDEFHATAQQLGARFEAQLTEQGRSLDLACDVGLMLDWKWVYADGDLSWWRIGHLDELLLEWYPRKVSAPPDLADHTLPSIAAFLGFLGDEGLLSPASDRADALQRHVAGMTDAFMAAMGDTSRFGMAKSLFGAVGDDVDLDDPAAVQEVMDAFNALPFEHRDRILAGPMADMADRAGASRTFRPVVLASPNQLRSAATRTRWYPRVLDFLDWVGDGRKLTQGNNNITLAGARELVDLLDADEVMDEQIGERAFTTTSSTQLPTVDLTYRWARAAGLVKVRKGRLTRTARGAAARDDDPAALVRWLTDSLVDEVGVLAQRWRDAGRYAWDWHAEVVDDLVPAWLLELYEADSIEVTELADDAWDAIEDAFDLSRMTADMLPRYRGHIEAEIRRILRALEELGVLSVTDVEIAEENLGPIGGEGADYVLHHEVGGTATITPLGTWVIHARASAVGETTAVGELADADAATLLERVADLPDQLAGAEVDAWLAARDIDDAVAALSAALADASDTGLGVGFRALSTVGAPAAPRVAGLRDHPRLGPYARVWQVDAMAVEVTEVRSDDPVLQARMVAAATDLWGHTAAPRWVTLVVGSDDVAQLADAVAAWWRVEGETITEVLELLGTDDRKPLAKAARKALFKRRSAS